MLQKLTNVFRHRRYSTKSFTERFLFEYTSGRFLYNEDRRLNERLVHFDIDALKSAAVRCAKGAAAVTSMTKLPEGTFNKVYLMTLDTGDEIIARIPNPNAGAPDLVTSSEVATMAFARERLDIPVPKVLGWNASSSNDVKSQYILMEKARGVPLYSVWSEMPLRVKLAIVRSLVGIEGKFTAQTLASGGSLYLDDPQHSDRPKADSRFTVGPSTDRHFWRHERRNMSLACGPWQTPTDYISAIAIREKAYIASHARSFPEGSQKRELEELAEPATHLDALDQYLALAPYLVPNKNPELSAFCLWHPDLHSKNIFVSPCTDENGRASYTITDVIDWQHAVVAPVYLQARFSQFIRDVGPEDLVPQSTMPEAPEGIESLSKDDPVLDDFRRKALFHMYFVGSMNRSPAIAAAFSHPILELVTDPTRMAEATWGNSWSMELPPFRSSISNVIERWADIVSFTTPYEIPPVCPVHIDAAQMKRFEEQVATWETLRSFLMAMMEQIGIDQQGWVPADMYETCTKRNAELFAQWVALERDTDADESAREINREERRQWWPFQDGAEDIF